MTEPAAHGRRPPRRVPQRPSMPPVLVGLIAVNVAVFIAWYQLPASWVAPNFVCSLDGVRHGRVWTLLTAAFSHYDTNHLLFNMIGLYVFGRGITGLVGQRDLLHLYLVGGVASMLGHVGWMAVSGSQAGALGASGAVMAFGTVFAALRPQAVLLVGFVLPLRAPLAVALFVLLDLSGVLGGPSSSGVAHAAHLAGAAYGLLWWLWWRRRG